jgi:hypothetical protein
VGGRRKGRKEERGKEGKFKREGTAMKKEGKGKVKRKERAKMLLVNNNITLRKPIFFVSPTSENQEPV